MPVDRSPGELVNHSAAAAPPAGGATSARADVGELVITLKERSRSEPLVIPGAARTGLFEVARERLRILATADPGVLILETTSWVGTISVPGLTVRIEPSIPVHSILAMLSGSAEEIAWGREHTEYGEDDVIVDGAARVVIRAIDAATRRGLLHGYLTREEKLSTIRGRLMVDQLARRPWEIASPPCRYDDFTSDIAENRRLRCALVTMLQTPNLSAATRREAIDLLTRFADVSYTPPSAHAVPIPITRLNEHYGSALELATLALQGLSVTHEAGSLSAHAFLVNVDDVFSRFVATALEQRLWPGLEVDHDARLAIDDAGALDARADVVVRRRGRARLVIGASYRLVAPEQHPEPLTSGQARYPAANVRPMASVASDAAAFFPVMVQAASLNLNHALVVYAHADRRPASRIRMPGTDINVHSWHVDISGGWDEMTAGLDDLADFVRTLAAAR